MRRHVPLVTALLVLLGSAPLQAKDLQRDLRSRWLGAWVVLTSEVASDCSGMHTNNRVSGQLTLGRGMRSFEPGELGRVTGVDLKRSRVDVFVDLREDVLLAYQDGPFELYRQADCRVELLVQLTRPMVKGKDVEGIDGRILEVVERHVSQAEAETSERWNRREREPYPADYELRLARHAVWKAETRNEAIDEKIHDARESARAVLAKVSVERPGYGEAFAHGVEVMNARRLEDCDRMLAGTFDSWKSEPPEEYHEEGHYDGQLLSYSIRLADRLEKCYVTVPDLPEETSIAAAQP